MGKLKLYRIYDIKCDGNVVISAKKELVAELEDMQDAVQYPDDLEELYIMRFDENDNVIKIEGMVFGGYDLDESDELYDEYNGYMLPYIDVAEWDYRVYASVAFGVDLAHGKVRK